jgi:hypothetical protein
MRYAASEKLEIIHLVEQSHLPVRVILSKTKRVPKNTSSGSSHEQDLVLAGAQRRLCNEYCADPQFRCARHIAAGIGV